MALLFPRWKDWGPERLVSLLRIFSISSFNSTCWQKSYSWLPKTFSYFKFKFSLDFILPLLFQAHGAQAASWHLEKASIPCHHCPPYTGFSWDIQPHLVLNSDGWPSRPAFAEEAEIPSGPQAHGTDSHHGWSSDQETPSGPPAFSLPPGELPNPSQMMWNRVCSLKAGSARKLGRQAMEALYVLTHSVALSTYPLGHLTSAEGSSRVCCAFSDPTLDLVTSYLSLLFFFWLHHEACRILVPWLVIETVPLQWQLGVLTTEPAGRSWSSHFCP